MIFNVVIIDDEPGIQAGMRKLIDWSKEQCRIAGEAANGIEGIELITRLKPDIIITDIHMPSTNIDGLSMIKKIRKIVPESKVIIVTGYMKLEYLHEAIKLGAMDYFRKPIKIDGLIATLRKAVMELQYKAKRREKLDELKDHFTRTLPLLREKLLYDIIFRIATQKEEIEADLELYEAGIRMFLIVLIEINDRGQEKIPNYNKQLYKIGMINFFTDTFKEKYTMQQVTLSQNRFLVIIGLDSEDLGFEEDVCKKVEGLQEIVKSCFDLNITAAISTRGKGWEDLSSRVQECLEAIEYKFYMGEGALIHYADLDPVVPAGDLSALEKLGKDLISSIRLGDEERAVLLLQEKKTFFDSNNLNIKVVRNYYIKLIYEIDYFLNPCNGRKNEWDPGKLYRELNHSTRITDFQAILRKLVIELAQKSKDKEDDRINIIIKRAIEYIEHNFSQEQLDLKEVAANAFASVSYVCRMFPKVTGYNFVDYLAKVRVRYASEYFKDPSLKIYEVAEMVGFSDPHYFSKVFKKHTNKTPTEYRNKHCR